MVGRIRLTLRSWDTLRVILRSRGNKNHKGVDECKVRGKEGEIMIKDNLKVMGEDERKGTVKGWTSARSGARGACS